MQSLLLIMEKLSLVALVACASISATAFSHSQIGYGLMFIGIGIISLFAGAGFNYFRDEEPATG